MSLVYLKFGNLQDTVGAGVTVGVEGVHDGLEFKAFNGMNADGFMREEITQAEHETWQARIANPDNEAYFAGMFPGIGVIDKATRATLDAQIQAAKDAAEARRKATLSVKRVQALIALNRAGTTKADIYAVIGALPAAQQEEALLWFEDSQHFVRNHPYINAIGQALGYSQADLDALFAVAELIA